RTLRREYLLCPERLQPVNPPGDTSRRHLGQNTRQRAGTPSGTRLFRRPPVQTCARISVRALRLPPRYRSTPATAHSTRPSAKVSHTLRYITPVAWPMVRATIGSTTTPPIW